MMTTTNANNDNGSKVCPQCGAAFTCDISAGEAHCWCFDLPNVLPLREDASCLCSTCLRAAIAEAMNAAQRELQRQHEQGISCHNIVS
ncbi:MAG: cysteine-rich CWC family protein [Burkholderiales bacterium]|nr:cysteine-rich CWC family protein [Anaerolineae bacterium]